MKKNLLVNYNLLRILAIFFVIATHMLAGVWIADAQTQPMAWHMPGDYPYSDLNQQRPVFHAQRPVYFRKI